MLMITGLLLSVNFIDRFDLPIHDEAMYARALYRYTFGWGPLYQFVYHLLNGLTGSRVQSYDLILFSLTFFLLPLSTYSLSRSIGLDRVASAGVGLASLLAPWNYPSSPKIQIFNFTLLAFAFVIRWRWNRGIWGMLLFYSFLVASIFCRQDNLPIFAGFLLWDSIQLIRTQKWKWLSSILICNLALWMVGLWLFQSPFNQKRSWLAFRDHFLWRNKEYFEQATKQGLPMDGVLQSFFHQAKSLGEGIRARPVEVFKHFTNNVADLPASIWDNFHLITNSSVWGLVLTNLLILFLLLKRPQSVTETKPKADRIEVILFMVLIGSKSIIISTLLQPWSKYIFEVNLLIILALAWGLRRWEFKILPNKVWFTLLFPFCLLFHQFSTPVFTNEINLRKTVRILEEMNKQTPFQNTMCNFGVSKWSTLPDCFNIYTDRSRDQKIRRDFSQFLKTSGLDLVVLDPDYRRLIAYTGFEKEFRDLETAPDRFGFKKVETDSKEPAIYVSNSWLERHLR